MKLLGGFRLVTIFILAGCAVGAIFLFGGCGKEGVQESKLVILCGNSFIPPTEALIAEFKAKTGVNATFTTGGSEDLLPNVKVMMGQGDLERKWKRVRTVLSGAGGSGSFSCLDLRFDDQVLLTRSASGKSMVGAGRMAKPSEGK